MDWLRRNWPDLTIGVALVAVIALIVATLLSGGSLASLVRRDNPPEIPITNTTGSTAGNTAGTAETEGTADAIPGATGTTAGAEAAADDGDIDVFVPGIPDGQAGGAEADTASGADSDVGSDQVLPTLPGDAENVAGTGVAETATGPLPEASAAGGFRVAAGALDSRDAAGTLAQSYRDDGYEVTVERQGALYLLWIGPYTTREDADTAAARIVADGGDALVYTYSGEDAGDGAADSGDADLNEADTNEADTAGAVTGAGIDAGAGAANNTTNNTANSTVNNAAGEADQAANTGNDAAATTVAGQRYLQVGAFAADENAQPLRDRLEQLGLDITSSEDAGGLVRLFVGPFGNAQLTQTRTRLDAQGIDSFPVVR